MVKYDEIFFLSSGVKFLNRSIRNCLHLAEGLVEMAKVGQSFDINKWEEWGEENRQQQ